MKQKTNSIYHQLSILSGLISLLSKGISIWILGSYQFLLLKFFVNTSFVDLKWNIAYSMYYVRQGSILAISTMLQDNYTHFRHRIYFDR